MGLCGRRVAAVVAGVVIALAGGASGLMPASADTGGGQAGQWSQVPAPEQLSARQTVASVALDDGSVWSVGGYLACGDWACRGSARIQRWDGAAWTDRQVPQDGRSDSEVTGYAPLGSDAVLVALRVWNPGTEAQQYEDQDSEELLVTLDGSDAQLLPAPDADIYDLSGTASSMWSLAGAGDVWHWDGASWTAFPLPPDVDPLQIAAYPGGAFVSGVVNDSSGDHAILIRWAGGGWVPVPLANPSTPWISGLAVDPAGRPWIVVADGDSSVRLLRWDGQTWVSLGDVPSTDVFARAKQVVASSPNDVWLMQSDRLDHWNGESWQREGGPSRWSGLGETPDGRVWAGLSLLRPIAAGDPPAEVSTARGGSVWVRGGDNGATVEDPSGTVSFDLLPGQVTGQVFADAGTFQLSGLGTAVSVAVEPELSPDVIDPDRSAQLRWGDASDSGLLYDVEVRRPHTSGFVPFRDGTDAPGTHFHPDAGPGIYTFRTRCRRVGASASDWSPEVSLRVRSEGTATPSWHRLASIPDGRPTTAYAIEQSTGSVYINAPYQSSHGLVRIDRSGDVAEVPVPQGITAVTARSRRDVWAVGGGPVLYHLTDHLTQVPVPGAFQTINRIESHGGALWALGDGVQGSVVARRSADGWQVFRFPALSLTSLSFVSNHDVWVGGDGEVVHWNGTRWRRIGWPTIGTPAWYTGLLPFRHEVWLAGACCANGVVFRWDGERFVRVATVLDGAAELDLFGSDPNDLWIDGARTWHMDGRNPVQVSMPWFSHVIGVRRNGSAVAFGCCDHGAGVVLQLDPMRLGDDGFLQPRAWVQQGAQVAWRVSSTAHRRHGVRDDSGLGLVSARLHKAGATFFGSFPAAGSYPIVDPQTGSQAVAQVPLEVDHGTQLQLAPLPLSRGRVVDVELQRPGDAGFSPWIDGTADPVVSLPTDPGTYLVRARLRDSDSGAASGWSPVLTVTVA